MMKFRLYLDKDEETKWLNEMMEEGYAMTGFFAGFYRFEESEKGKYIYQVDFSDRLFAVSENYREFMQEMGVEIVQIWGPWVIVRRLAKEGEFELYTDVDSNIEHYRKIRRMFKAVTMIELFIFFIEIAGAIGGSSLACVCSFVMGAILVALANVVFKTNQIIARLEEEKGEQPSLRAGRQVSLLISSGLLLNGCALLLEDNINGKIKTLIQMIAILLMLAGVFQTCKKRKK